MPTMYFTLDDELLDDAGEEVPVEVAASDMSLVVHTISSASLEVKPGTYFVTPRVPELEGFTQRVVVEKEAMGVMLRAHRRFKYSEISVYFFHGGFAGVGPLPSAAFLWQPRIKLFTGNLFSGIQPFDREPVLYPQESYAMQFRFRVPPIAGPVLAQIWTVNDSATNIVLPVAEKTGCTIIVEPHAWPKPRFSCELDHFQANRLLKWREAGQLSAADAIRSSPRLGIDSTLYEAPNPIAAVVTAYSLFQFGDLERMDAWSIELSRRFPNIADGFALRAEYLARVGEHESAARTMLKTRAVGLPIFSEGITFLMKRLDMYTSSERFIGLEALKELTTFREELSSFARFLDPRNPFCCYPGLDPKHPSADVNLNLRQVQLGEELGGIV